MTRKIFKTRVLDSSTQETRIMDVHGYSHFGPTGYTYQAGSRLQVREVYFTGWTNKAKLNAAIKQQLGDAFWPNLNYAERF